MTYIKQIGRVAGRIHRRYDKIMFRELEKFNLGRRQARIILILHEEGCMPQCEMDKRFDVDRAVVKKSLDCLEAAGWIARERREGDNRRYYIRLTQKGSEIAPVIQELVRKVNDELLSGMDGKAADLLFSYLEIVQKNADEILKKSD